MFYDSLSIDTYFLHSFIYSTVNIQLKLITFLLILLRGYASANKIVKIVINIFSAIVNKKKYLLECNQLFVYIPSPMKIAKT